MGSDGWFEFHWTKDFVTIRAQMSRRMFVAIVLAIPTVLGASELLERVAKTIAFLN